MFWASYRGTPSKVAALPFNDLQSNEQTKLGPLRVDFDVKEETLMTVIELWLRVSGLFIGPYMTEIDHQEFEKPSCD